MKKPSLICRLAFTAVLAIAGLSGCAAEDQPDAAQVLEESMETDEKLNQTPVTLHVYSTTGERASQKNIEAYIQKTMPNVTVESIFENGPKMESAQLAAVKNGEGPEILYTQDYYNYVQNGYLKDLTSEPYLKNYMISALNEAEVGSKVYALPIGNGVISGLFVNQRQLKEMGYEVPQTQEELTELCRQIQAEKEVTGVRAYACSMLYSESSAVVTMPFLLDAYTDSSYVQWLASYRSDPSSVSFGDPAFSRVLERITAFKDLGLCENGDYLANDVHNLQQVMLGEAVFCSSSYSTFASQYVNKIENVDNVPYYKVKSNNEYTYVLCSDVLFVPYPGKTSQDQWLATNGDWYMGINGNVTDEATLKACSLYLEYIASTPFAPEIYGASPSTRAITYYRRDDAMEHDFFKEKYPEVYQCLVENSVVKNPYQFYGSDIYTFAQQHFICGKKYYAGLDASSAYLPVDNAADILSALEEYRTQGVNRYEVPDRLVGKTEKAYHYVRIYSRSNESAMGNLLADAIRDYTKAELAVINAGSLTAGIEAGDITESGLATSMLYGLSNHLVTARCKGENLMSVLATNNVAKTAGLANEAGVLGGLVIPSGFTYTIDYRDGQGAAISDVRLANGEPMDPEAYYTVTTTDYALNGVDGWEAFALLSGDMAAGLPEGIEIFKAFDQEDASRCVTFDLDSGSYEKQYGQITNWALEQPNIIEAVIRYIETHSKNGLLEDVTTDGRIRAVNIPKRLDPSLNGIDLS